jgi:hypothetical protein
MKIQRNKTGLHSLPDEIITWCPAALRSRASRVSAIDRKRLPPSNTTTDSGARTRCSISHRLRQNLRSSRVSTLLFPTIVLSGNSIEVLETKRPFSCPVYGIVRGTMSRILAPSVLAKRAAAFKARRVGRACVKMTITSNSVRECGIHVIRALFPELNVSAAFIAISFFPKVRRRTMNKS